MAADDRCTKRIRKAAYSLYFDLGYGARQIQREVCPTFSIQTVYRMIKELEETFTWQAKKAVNRAAPRVMCSKSLDVLSQLLTGDPTMYLSQLKKALRNDYGVKVSVASNMKEHMEWVDHINRGDFHQKNVLVLDECSVGTNASRRVRGYGSVGHRVR